MAKNKPKKDSVKALLYIKKSHLESSLVRAETFIARYDENLKSQVPARIAAFKPLLSEYSSVIQDLAVESCDHSQDLENLEETYFSVLSRLEELLGECDAPPILKNQNLNTSSIQNNIKLPQISLPTFNGDLCSWKPFYDNFLSLIVNNETLSDVQRFHYLKSSLRGPPSDIIANLPITQVNFHIAWNLIKDRYDQPRLIIQGHVNSLLSLPAMKPGPSRLKELCELTNIFFKAVRALQALDQNTEEASFILVPLLTNKLDAYLLRAWETDLSAHKIPKLSQLEDFLVKQINILQACGNSNNNNFSSNYKAPSTINSENKPKPNPNTSFKPNKYVNKSHGNNTYSKPTCQSYAVSSNVQTASGGGAPRQQPIKTNTQPNQDKFINSNPGSSPNPVSKMYPCYICQELHRLYQCPEFLAMTSEKRYELVRSKSLCLNCFNPFHKVNVCQSKFVCKLCGEKHNSLIHQTTQSHSSSVSVNCFSSKRPKVLLATAVVELIGNNGNSLTVRALLDSGAQGNFICETLVQKLRLNKSKCDVPIVGIGDSPAKVSHQVTALVQSKVNKFNLQMSFLVMKNITSNLPQVSFDASTWQIPPNITLADPYFFDSKGVDILIGAQYFFEILSQGKIVLSKNLPILQATHFGWIVSGNYESISTPRPIDFESLSDNECKSFLAVSPLDSQSNLDSLLNKFWEIDQCLGEKPQLSVKDHVCEKYYQDTTTRLESGRYLVRLPFSKDPAHLGESYEKALNYFYSIERKFAKNPNLHKLYSEFINEYQSLGHMVELPIEDYSKVLNRPHYFLPHHAVLRDESLTTRLRVVFNASMPTSSGLSLNDVLAVGPQLLNDSFEILLRFRCYLYALIGDVAKMYRQIDVHESDTYYQLIIWRNKPTDPIQIFRLVTVTYGTAPAPYLAIRTTHQLARDEHETYPIASKIILNDFYMDDLISGANTVQEVLQLQKDLSSVFQTAGMELRKWCSNCPNLNLDNDNEFYSLSRDDNVKTLGIVWKPIDDTFRYKIDMHKRELVTKRIVVSDICRLFDPLGLLGPTVMMFKTFIRKLWLEKIEWDEELPSHLFEHWSELISQLHLLNQIKIPRYISSISNPARYELHGFCDASEVGYGACIYLKCIEDSNNASVQLLCSKSRVSPTRVQSIPRLELCGALLLSELYHKVKSALTNIVISHQFCWTDSMIVIHWINSESSRWKTFVSNRVSKIQELTQECTWLHISSTDNPADMLSRGTLELNEKWWHGPEFLLSTLEYPNPSSLSVDCTSLQTEERPIVSLNVAESYSTDTLKDVKDNPLENLNFSRFNSWNKFVHSIAYSFRFVRHSLRSRQFTKNKGPLSVEEINKAKIAILKIVQAEMFPDEIKILKLNKPLPKTNRLLALTPFLDYNDLLRVGGRLKNAFITYNQKHPILLTSNHRVTQMIVEHFHRTTLHCGPQGLLYAVRQEYWPISGKNLCKKIVRNCITCFKVKPYPAKYLMGDLPCERVTLSRPFTNTGLDYAGPILIRQSMNRKAPLVKAYIAIFVCLVTKAVHLEAVSDLSTNSFIAALRRFVSRRGLCKTIFCDNGTNFVGANNVLKDLYKLYRSKDHINKVITSFYDTGISFKFIPSRSPSFGGIWEAAVKSAKYHLRRVIEELITVLTQIESQLNSRPLTPLSDNPNDLSTLSPAHFLVGGPLTSIPDEPNLGEKSSNSLSRWQHVQECQQEFWRRWRHEYLNQLQQRGKWRSNVEPIKEGILVLLMDENTPPMLWPRGRIMEVHKGKDGIARVATVRTQHGETVRAINKLCPLPIDDSNCKVYEDLHHSTIPG